jgi:hypothetical protein
VVEAVASEPPGLEILNDEIGVADEVADRFPPLLAREVDLASQLAAIGCVEEGSAEIGPVGVSDERRPPFAGVVARSRSLDLDDLGSEISEQLPAPGTGEDAGELDDTQIRKWPPSLVIRPIVRPDAYCGAATG